MWEGVLPPHVAAFMLEREIDAACQQRKTERLIYSRNAKKGLGR